MSLNKNEEKEAGRVIRRRKLCSAQLKAAVWNTVELAKIDNDYTRGTIVNIANNLMSIIAW
jgi:hypothetical protein